MSVKLLAAVLLLVVIVVAVNAMLSAGQEKATLKEKLKVMPGGLGRFGLNAGANAMGKS